MSSSSIAAPIRLPSMPPRAAPVIVPSARLPAEPPIARCRSPRRRRPRPGCRRPFWAGVGGACRQRCADPRDRQNPIVNLGAIPVPSPPRIAALSTVPTARQPDAQRVRASGRGIDWAKLRHRCRRSRTQALAHAGKPEIRKFSLTWIRRGTSARTPTKTGIRHAAQHQAIFSPPTPARSPARPIFWICSRPRSRASRSTRLNARRGLPGAVKRSCRSRSTSASTSSTTANTPSRALSPTSTNGLAASCWTARRPRRGPWVGSREAISFPDSTRRSTSARGRTA